MFGIGGFELFLIILFGFLIFGPDKLPEIAKTVGMAINKFKKAKDEMDGVIKEEIFDPSAPEPFKDPSRALDRAHSKVKAKTERPEHEETFAERKARYDRERAEMKKRSELDQKKQAEIDANRAKMKEEAAAKAKAQAKGDPSSQDQADSQDHAQQDAPVKPQSKRPTADELYGNVPMNKEFIREKPAEKPVEKSAEKPAPSATSSEKGGEA